VLCFVTIITFRALAACSPGGTPFDTGYNLSHSEVDITKVPDCHVQGPGITLASQDNILLNYQDPRVRTQTRAELEQMAAQGATAMRTFVWFAIQPNPTAATHLGVATVGDDGAAKQIASNAATLVSDARSAGYRHLFLAFGPFGKLAPNCRQQNWGDCFDSNTLSETWKFEATIIRAARQAAQSQIRITFDLGNELCFDDSGSLLDREKQLYVSTLSRSYVTSFHDRNFTVSCHGPHLAGFIRRLKATYALFQMQGTVPNTITLHLGHWPLSDLTEVLMEADTIAIADDSLVAVDEIPYDSLPIYHLIGALIRDGGISRLRDTLFWPNAPASGCHISIAPPYNLRPMEQSLALPHCQG
jgi:hypothetical protein